MDDVEMNPGTFFLCDSVSSAKLTVLRRGRVGGIKGLQEEDGAWWNRRPSRFFLIDKKDSRNLRWFISSENWFLFAEWNCFCDLDLLTAQCAPWLHPFFFFIYCSSSLSLKPLFCLCLFLSASVSCSYQDSSLLSNLTSSLCSRSVRRKKKKTHK